jgi:multiple sugar transport system substrate-binding protein
VHAVRRLADGHLLQQELVDFDRMRNRGLDAPTTTTGWSFDQFAAAAKFATVRAAAPRASHRADACRGLAPFIYSGGGKVFDDDDDPTSLAFSDDDTQAALERRSSCSATPSVTLTRSSSPRQTPLQWFERASSA